MQLARQAGQIRVGIPGSMARWCSSVLTSALADAGDLAAAERVGAQGLAWARDADDQQNLPSLLYQLAGVDVQAGRIEEAAARLREADQISARAGNRAGLLDGLECCGCLCVATGRWAGAVTVWAAWAALQRHAGHVAVPHARIGDEPLRQARQALGPARTQAAEDRGAAMSWAAAIEYARTLTSPGAQHPQAPPGLGKLSARERELVTAGAAGDAAAVRIRGGSLFRRR